MREQIERFLIHLTAEEDSSANTVAAYRNDLNQLLISVSYTHLTLPTSDLV